MHLARLALLALPVAAGPTAPRSQLASPPRPSGAAELEWIGPNEHRFAEVVSGERVGHTFQLMSTGLEPLVVETFKVSCSCTTVEATRIDTEGGRHPYEAGQAVAPGEVLELWEQTDTTGKRGKLAYVTRLLVNTERGFATTALRMDAVDPIVVEPSYVDVGETWPNDHKQADFVLTNVWQEPFGIERVPHRDEFHTPLRLEPVDPDARGWARRWNAHVDVRGSQPARKKGWVPIPLIAHLADKPRFANADADGNATAEFLLGLVVDKIEIVRPRPLRLPVAPPAPGESYTGTFAILTPPDFELEKLEPSQVELLEPTDAPWAAGVSFALRHPEGSPWEVDVIFSRAPGPGEPPLSGAVRVRIDHPRQTYLDVPFGPPLPDR